MLWDHRLDRRGANALPSAGSLHVKVDKSCMGPRWSQDQCGTVRLRAQGHSARPRTLALGIRPVCGAKGNVHLIKVLEGT